MNPISQNCYVTSSLVNNMITAEDQKIIFMRHNITVLLFLVCVFLVSSTVSIIMDISKRSRELSKLFIKSIADVSSPDLVLAKKLLSQLKPDDVLSGLVGEKVPILHHLLNIFRLTNSHANKIELIELMLKSITFMTDTTEAFGNDPPLLFKTMLIKELHLTGELMANDPKGVANLLNDNSRWACGFLSNLYSIPSESVPLAKLLLHADTVVRKSGLDAMGGIAGVRKLLNGAVLGKPTVRPIDLSRHSDAYQNIVANLGGEQSQIRLLDIIKSLDETAGMVHKAMLGAILAVADEEERSNLILQFVRVLAGEELLGSDGIAYPMNRNALHFLCLSGGAVMLDQLGAFFSSLHGTTAEVPVGNNGETKPGSTVTLNGGAMTADDFKLCAAVLRNALVAIDVRGHSPISYAAMRFSRESPVMDALRRLCLAVGTDADAVLTEPTNDVSLPLGIVGGSGAGGAEASVDDGGWDPTRLLLSDFADLPTASMRGILEVHIDQLLTNDEFFRKYVNMGTPVVFRGVLKESAPPGFSLKKLRDGFKKDNFLAVYGNVSVPASTIPYAGNPLFLAVVYVAVLVWYRSEWIYYCSIGTFGVQQLVSTMKEVANSRTSSSSAAQDDGSVPLYTFCTPSMQWSRQLHADAPTPRSIARSKSAADEDCGVGNIDPSTQSWSYEIQFYLGSAGTGAPVHFHGHAINSLAYGEKVLPLAVLYFTYSLSERLLSLSTSALVAVPSNRGIL